MVSGVFCNVSCVPRLREFLSCRGAHFLLFEENRRPTSGVFAVSHPWMAMGMIDVDGRGEFIGSSVSKFEGYYVA